MEIWSYACSCLLFVLIVKRSCADALAYTGAPFGGGSGAIVLDNVQCVGDERSILNCTHNGIENSDCTHSEDAGVRCQGELKRKHRPH